MARKKAQALPRPEPEMWAVRGEIVQETEDAILLDVEGTEHWLPKSQIEYDGERGDVVDVELPDWLAEDKCLVDGEGIHTPPAPTPADNGAPQDDPGVPDDNTAPGIDANATVDLMLTIVDISENGEWATVQANGGEPCEIGTVDFTHDANEINAGNTLLCHVNTLAAMAAGLVGPDANVADKGVTWLRKDKFERTYPLNDEEKLELGNRMAEAQKRIDDLEDELADIRKEFKGQIEQQQKILSDAAKEFRDGKSEPCQVECNVFQDWNSEEIVYVACEDDVELFRRPMTAEEKQPTLFTSAPGGSAPLGEDPRRSMEIRTSAPMTWGHTCVNCAHLADKEAGQSEECATCAQAVEGGTDNWAPLRECKTCNYKTMSVTMPPCNGCIHNPDLKVPEDEADDFWIIAAFSGQEDEGAEHGSNVDGSPAESAANSDAGTLQ